jgi:hypothetical protein
VNHVVEVERLLLGGVENLREENPAHDEAADEADDKENPPYLVRTLLLLLSTHGTPSMMWK